MSAKDKAWSKVMKYAAEVAREKRDPKKGNPHLSWRDAQKRAWKDPRVVKEQAEYHIKYSKKTAKKPPVKRTTASGKRPRGRPPKNKPGYRPPPKASAKPKSKPKNIKKPSKTTKK